MRLPLILAASVLVGTTLLHTFGGEVTVHRPLRDGLESQEMRFYASLLWHFVTVFLAVTSVVALVALKRPNAKAALLVLAGLTSLMGVLFMVLGAAELGNLTTAPQWILLLPILPLVLWGTSNQPDKTGT